MWDCVMENQFIRSYPMPKSGVYQGDRRRERVIVSLTSFPERIETAYYAIKSLMIQSFQADEILLWLAEEQFPERRLPESYDDLISRGLQIRWCRDLKSHKKYYYVLQEQREDQIVITYDDDIIYEYDSIERLIAAHGVYPDCIVCNRGHTMKVSEGKLTAYSQWKLRTEEGNMMPSRKIMPSTGAGCLYPYHCMPSVTFDEKCIRENAFLADDIWMRFCSLQNDVQVVKTREKWATLCNVFCSQKIRLTQKNDIEGNNQVVIDQLLKIFPDTVTHLMK